MIDRYSNLLVFVEGINQPYLLNNSNMNFYRIIKGYFYDRKVKIGRVIAFNVEHKIPVKLGEHLCSEMGCEYCPLGFFCGHDVKWGRTLSDVLEGHRKEIPVEIYEILYKKINKNTSKEDKE